jgi:hypothetical protein
MAGRFSHAENEISARDLRVSFSPAVQDALRSIAVAARRSQHFDQEIYEIVKAWSGEAPITVHDVMIALPAIAGEVARHLSATHDKAMKDAWDELCSRIPENGFTVSQSRRKGR